MDHLAIPIRPPPCCDTCARSAMAAKREGKIGFMMCAPCADRERAARKAEEDAIPAADRDFLASLDRQLADAVTFLPPAMRASFHAQVGALIKLVQKVAVPHSWSTDTTAVSVAEWRIERERIRQRTGG